MERKATIPDERMHRWLAALESRSRRGAAQRGLQYELTDRCTNRLYADQHGRCAITGLRFDLMRFPDVLVKHPFAPSLHRCRAKRGYVPGNVELVCIAANFGMGEWDEEVYYLLADATARHSNWIQRMRSKRFSQLSDCDWTAEQCDRIAAAELIAGALAGSDLAEQRDHIAGLRRTLKLGRAGLTKAAERAARQCP